MFSPGLGGVISLLLIFPITFFGTRLADALPLLKSRLQRVILAVFLTLCSLVCALDALVGLLPLFFILTYAAGCVIHILLKGVRPRSFLISPLVLVCVIFAGMDFVGSVHPHPNRRAANEAAAVGTLRELFAAEQKFIEASAAGERPSQPLASINDLRKDHLIDKDLSLTNAHAGYFFDGIMEPTKKQFLFYATPAHFAKEAFRPEWTYFVPGASLVYVMFHAADTQGTGIRSFAVDETGIIRYTATHIPVPVTREQIAHWEAL